jgi:hypothetical protein
MELGKSCEAAELQANHSQIDPRFRAGLSPLVITHEPTVAHEPAKSAFHDPAAWQYGEALDGVGAFDDFDLELGPVVAHPLGEGVVAVATVDPEFAPAGKPVADPLEPREASLTVEGR